MARLNAKTMAAPFRLFGAIGPAVEGRRNNDWGDPDNWENGDVPVPGDTCALGGGSPPARQRSGREEFGYIEFGSSNFSISGGGGFTVDNGITVDSGVTGVNN